MKERPVVTDRERRAVEEEVRDECARIAALEAKYWAGVDDGTPEPRSWREGRLLGAMAAASNICAAILAGRSSDEVEADIARRDKDVVNEWAVESSEGKDGSMNQFVKETGWPQVHGEKSSVEFTIQSGPIKEFGVNGCQIDDVIGWAKEKIEGFNQAFPCRENAMVITKLDEALLWLLKRKADREARSVEGTNQK